MRLLEKIIAEMHLSMKSGEREKASALRILVSKLKDQEIKYTEKKIYFLYLLVNYIALIDSLNL